MRRKLSKLSTSVGYHLYLVYELSAVQVLRAEQVVCMMSNYSPMFLQGLWNNRMHRACSIQLSGSCCVSVVSALSIFLRGNAAHKCGASTLYSILVCVCVCVCVMCACCVFAAIYSNAVCFGVSAAKPQRGDCAGAVPVPRGLARLGVRFATNNAPSVVIMLCLQCKRVYVCSLCVLLLVFVCVAVSN